MTLDSLVQAALLLLPSRLSMVICHGSRVLMCLNNRALPCQVFGRFRF
jgi:hypothetical protein